MPTPEGRDPARRRAVRAEWLLLSPIELTAEPVLLDLSLADLVEGIVLHALDAKAPFGDDTLAKIAQPSDVYGLTLNRT